MHTASNIRTRKANDKTVSFDQQHGQERHGGSVTHKNLKSGFQAKLTIGVPDGPLEHEADAMADTIMQMPEQNFIQRKCSECEEVEKLQRKPLATFIQRKESSSDTAASDAVSNQINASKGNGSNMDSHTQSFMQSRFGTDFNDVKIHSGSEAIQMNRELNAKAFTVGNDIYFNEGQYNPGSGEGKHLLAHELVHTIQQGVENKIVQRECLTTAPASDEIEYITGSGESRRAYSFTDSAGAESFIRNHPDLNLICHRITRGDRTVYAIYQRRSGSPSPPGRSGGGGSAPPASGSGSATTSGTTTTSRRVCLTFDDGPQTGTENVLNELASFSIHGTFFLTGDNMDNTATQLAEQSRLVTRMINEGHGLGNHTFSHSPATAREYRRAYGTLVDSNATNDSATQLANFDSEYNRNTTHFSGTLGSSFTGFDIARLPGDGRTFSQLRARTAALGMQHVGWNFEFAPNGVFSWVPNNDWQGVTGVAASNTTLPRNNSVILFHDRHWAGSNQPKLHNLISFLQTQGYTFGVINSSGSCANP